MWILQTFAPKKKDVNLEFSKAAPAVESSKPSPPPIPAPAASIKIETAAREGEIILISKGNMLFNNETTVLSFDPPFDLKKEFFPPDVYKKILKLLSTPRDSDEPFDIHKPEELFDIRIDPADHTPKLFGLRGGLGAMPGLEPDEIWAEILRGLMPRYHSFKPELLVAMGFEKSVVDRAFIREKKKEKADKILTDFKSMDPRVYPPLSDSQKANPKYVHMTEIGVVEPGGSASVLYITGLELCSAVVGVVKDKKSGQVLRSAIAHFAPDGGPRYGDQFGAALINGFDQKKITVELYGNLTLDSRGALASVCDGLGKAQVKYRFFYAYQADLYLSNPQKLEKIPRPANMAVTSDGQVTFNLTGLKDQDFEDLKLIEYFEKTHKFFISDYTRPIPVSESAAAKKRPGSG